LSLAMSISILSPAAASKFATFATSKTFSDILDYDLAESSCVQIQRTPTGDYLFLKCSPPGGTDYFVCHPKDSLRVIDDQLDMYGYAIAKKVTDNNYSMYEIYPTGSGSAAQTYSSVPVSSSPIYARGGMSGYLATPIDSGSLAYGNYGVQTQPTGTGLVVPQSGSYPFNSVSPNYNLMPNYNLAPNYNLMPNYNLTPNYNLMSNYNLTPNYNLIPNYNFASTYNPYSGNYGGQQTPASIMGSESIVPPSLLLDISSAYNPPIMSPYPVMPDPLLSINYRYPLSMGSFPFAPTSLFTALQVASNRLFNQAVSNNIQAVSNNIGTNNNLSNTFLDAAKGNLSNLAQTSSTNHITWIF